MVTEEPKCPFRAIGFTPKAADFPRDDLAICMFAAFNNVKPEQLTEGMRFFPNESTQKAWARVAQAAREFIEKDSRDA